MKILHTGDWHLGKIFHEHSLLEDQKYFLQQIIQTLENAQNKNEAYDALIIAGDIYDRAVPPPEAVSLLSDFLTKANKKFSSLHIFIISGNHDSPDRLAFASAILDESKIHIATDAKKFESPIILGKENEQTAFYSIPFLTPSMLQIERDSEKAVLHSQKDLLQNACEKIKAFHKKKFPAAQTCVVAHAFVTFAQIGNSERRFVGDVDCAPCDFFSDFTYSALGHIHKFQQIKKNSVFYSGAPLVYAFDDFKNECVMISAILREGKLASLEKINFSPLHKVVRLEGKFEDFFGKNANKEIISQNQNNYVEFVLQNLAGIENPIGFLRKNFPFALSIKKANSFSKDGANKKKAALASNSKDKIQKLFDDFIDDIYDGKIKISCEEYEAEKKLFLELAKKYSWQ